MRSLPAILFQLRLNEMENWLLETQDTQDVDKRKSVNQLLAAAMQASLVAVDA